MHQTRSLIALFATLSFAGGCGAPDTFVPSTLNAGGQYDFDVSEQTEETIALNGFLNFDEKIEIATQMSLSECNFATYEFQFEYEASVIVEFRDGPEGYCSYGAILLRSFEVRVLAEQEYPEGSDLAPFIQFQQSDPHIAVFQIGRDYFAERVSDLRNVEISCWRGDCSGTVERRVSEENTKT